MVLHDARCMELYSMKIDFKILMPSVMYETTDMRLRSKKVPYKGIIGHRKITRNTFCMKKKSCIYLIALTGSMGILYATVHAHLSLGHPCRSSTTGNPLIAVCLKICRVPKHGHTANLSFAVCQQRQSLGTWQKWCLPCVVANKLTAKVKSTANVKSPLIREDLNVI